VGPDEEVWPHRRGQPAAQKNRPHNFAIYGALRPARTPV